MKPFNKPQALILGLSIFLASTLLYGETSIQAIALFNDKAMLTVNGSRAKIVTVGESIEGVLLVSSNTDQALIEVDGQREIITLNSGASIGASLGIRAVNEDATTAEIWANDKGFFQSRGRINGRAVNFLVDTGANLVVLSSAQADRIDLDYINGIRSSANTASGVTAMYLVTLEKISFQGIELADVQAGVILGQHPAVPLLGMSFLQKLNMNRSGNVMRLSKL